MNNLNAVSPQESHTLIDLLQRRADQQADKLAYTFLQNGEVAAGTYTYAQLDAKARAIAAQLLAHNAQNERAILLYQPSLDYIAAFFGCLYAGVTAVPAYPPNPRRPINRIKAILDDATPAIALTTSDIYSKILRRMDDDPVLKTVQWISTDEVDTALGETWVRPDNIEGETLAFLQYTSGSTSTPKGVMVSHRNLLSTMKDMYLPWGHTPDSVMVTWLPIFHDLGLIYGILTPLYGGYQCVLFDPVAFMQKPLRWLQAISDFKATHSHSPNFGYELCLLRISDEERDALDLSSWQVTLNAAETVRLNTMTRFTERFGAVGFDYNTFCPGFGLAEASLKVSAQEIGLTPISRRVNEAELEQHRLIDDENGVDIVGCGTPAIDADIRIVNPETKLMSPESEVGEIWVSSASIAQGYWERPEATAETFQAHIAESGEGPFMRTGDLGFLWQGELFITGRIKDLLIIRGRNIYPQDVELAVERSHEAMRGGCTAAFSQTIDGVEQLVVVQEIKRTFLRTMDADEVLTAARRAITSQFDVQPHAIVLLRTGSVLKTSSGKIQRQGNKKAYLAGELKIVGEWQAPKVAKVAPSRVSQAAELPSRNQIINWISMWLAQRLDVMVTSIEPTAPFVDLGLDSVLAVELAHELEAWLPTEIELDGTMAWNYPTIVAVADYILTPEQEKEAEQNADTQDLENLDELSEEELVALLAQEAGLGD